MNLHKLLFLILMFGSISCENEVDHIAPVSPQFVVDKYYQAIGGYENQKAIRNIEKIGHYMEPAYDFLIPANMKRMRPDFKHVGNIETVGFEEGYNGIPWEYHVGKGLILSEGEAAEAILVSKDFEYAFVDADKKGNQLKYNGIQMFGGLPSHAVEVIIPVMKNKYKTTFYFDVNSFLLLGQWKVMPIHATGDDVEIQVSFSDYRKVNGILFPFASIERNAINGEFLNAAIWSKIIANQNMTLDEFDPPSNDQ